MVRNLAPLRSNWVKTEQFDTMPPIWGAEGAHADARHIFVFHKRPNMKGHHFKVNGWTADLLSRCDGTMTVDDLVRYYQQRTNRPPRDLALLPGGPHRADAARLNVPLCVLFGMPEKQPHAPAPRSDVHLVRTPARALRRAFFHPCAGHAHRCAHPAQGPSIAC